MNYSINQAFRFYNSLYQDTGSTRGMVYQPNHQTHAESVWRRTIDLMEKRFFSMVSKLGQSIEQCERILTKFASEAEKLNAYGQVTMGHCGVL